jgi:hypothetical protein
MPLLGPHDDSGVSGGGGVLWDLEAAGMAVAQDVVDDLEHPPAGGDLGDVASWSAAAGQDAFLDRSDSRFAGTLDRLDGGPTDQGAAFLADLGRAGRSCPTRNAVGRDGDGIGLEVWQPVLGGRRSVSDSSFQCSSNRSLASPLFTPSVIAP